VTLPLTPTIEPQLAKSATEFPSEGTWLYEPKWDGFRVIAFVDGDEVFLQSRNGKPLDRYFPELSLPPGRYVLDGEIVIDPGDGSQDFGALQQRIHPAASRVELLARETPASIVAFDLLAQDDAVLLEQPFTERRAALERLLADTGGHPVTLTPQERTPEGAQRWLETAEGVIAKQADAPYLPGKRIGMFKLRQRRTLDCVITGYRPGKEPDSVGSLILGLYDDDGKLHVVGHCSAFTRKEKKELLGRLRPLETGERGSGEPSRWTAGRDLEWVELRPELVVEVSYDHMSDGRIRHGTRVERWRTDRDPESCKLEQLV
jgi:ATP-dependent DNA ligase